MKHRELDGWIDALTRKKPNGSPAVGWGPRRNAARRLARYAFADPSVLELVRSAALSDPDRRVQQTARAALRHEILRQMKSERFEARLEAIRQMRDLGALSPGEPAHPTAAG